MIDQAKRHRYSYFVNAMLFLFALFVNIHNTVADVALFGLFMAGVYILKKNKINPFNDSRLRILLLITAGYYFSNLVVFFINGTYFAKYLQTDVYFLLAVFVAAAVLHAKVNINLFFSGIRLALLFMGVCHFLSFVYTNIYVSIFAPVIVLMMFLSIVSFDNDNLINKILGMSAFVFGMILVVDSTVRLSWVVFIVLMIIMPFLMFKKIGISKFPLMIFFVLMSVVIYFINSNTINTRITQASNQISSWNSGENLDSSIGIRLEMYSAGLDAFKEKPFFGHGFLNGTKEVSKYASPRVSIKINNYSQLHSEYVTTMVEKGIFGLLSFGILLLSPVLVIVRNYSKDDIYIKIGVISSISFILFGLFNASFGDTTIKAFYVLLICLFLPNLHRERFD